MTQPIRASLHEVLSPDHERLRALLAERLAGDKMEILGTTLETAIRLMSRWQKEQIVITEKSGFKIPRIELLREVAQES